MNAFFSIFSLSDILFLCVCVIMSLVVWSLWFHAKVFWNLYARWMGLPVPKPGQMPKGMAQTFLAEIVSRIMYFGFLTFVFIGTREVAFDSGESVSLFVILMFVLAIYIGIIFPTQLSQIAWTKAQKKAVFLIWGNTLLQSLIAGGIWFVFFA